MAVIAMRDALNQALREEMARDQDVFIMGEDIAVFEGSYKVTLNLLKEFGPKRVIDTPIAEEGFIGAGIGAAMMGLRPVVEIMTINFILVAMDQVVNHAAKTIRGLTFQNDRTKTLALRRLARLSNSLPHTVRGTAKK